MGKFKETPSWKEEKYSGLDLHVGAFAGAPISSAAMRKLADGNGPSNAAFRVGFLCFRSDCYFALTVNSVYS